ncbi:N-acylneuraminate cytidylyltransferase [Synechococcus sp. RS9907]|nr:N-acylneuraminate cytidylyltransferase [Synechococcus sp. RS9907]
MDLNIIAMVPARLGSQRLSKKNLRLLNGIPLVSRALKKCLESECFDEIWMNSEDLIFKNFADQHGVNFYKRPAELSNNTATSEDFVCDFLTNVECDYIVQVHSIAPLLSVESIKSFVTHLKHRQPDALMSVELIQLEALFQNKPINFTFEQKTNSQDLSPVQRISWSITAWKRDTFLQAVQAGECATYFGKIEFFPVNAMASHVIKTEQDLKIAEALLPLIDNS